VPVKAPYAQSLVRKTANAHPELVFLGLHVMPPGKSDNVIILAPKFPGNDRREQRTFDPVSTGRTGRDAGLPEREKVVVARAGGDC
jgi:hypothetical protein